MTTETLLPTREISEYFNVTGSTVRLWIRAGKLQGVHADKRWWVTESSAKAWRWERGVRPQPEPEGNWLPLTDADRRWLAELLHDIDNAPSPIGLVFAS